MQKTLTAIEYDGLDARTISMTFEVPSADFDIKEALAKAVTDFCKTEEGAEVYGNNCRCFNLADVDMYLPKAFCEKYGFSFISTVISDECIGWDEQFCDKDDM